MAYRLSLYRMIRRLKSGTLDGTMADQHLPDSDLERYAQGMIHNDAELRWIEDHLYRCPDCAERMWAIQEHLDSPAAGSPQTAEHDLFRKNRPVQ